MQAPDNQGKQSQAYPPIGKPYFIYPFLPNKFNEIPSKWAISGAILACSGSILFSYYDKFANYISLETNNIIQLFFRKNSIKQQEYIKVPEKQSNLV